MALRSTTAEVLCAVGLLVLSFAGQAAGADLIETRIGYLNLTDDPDYQTNRGYASLGVNDRGSPKPGAELALKDSQVTAEAIGRKFTLVGKTIEETDDAAEALTSFTRDEKLDAVIVDLPAEMLQTAALAPANSRTVLFNIRARSDELRQNTCATKLFHVIPSQAMVSDASAQFLAQKGWRKVLLLEGGQPEDKLLGTSFRRAAKKFGLKIVATKPFVMGNDPRKREEINVPLMTSDADYDAVYVAEVSGEFARYVPYETSLPRPVFGSSGLMADGWHVSWERQGAPQLTHRFQKIAGRAMTDPDWSAWMAVRSVIEATIARPTLPLATALVDQDLTMDGYKGAAGSFRPWDRQLRQPILLHTADAVVAYAPLEGFLHEVNKLDTLGFDKPEFKCPAK